MATTATETLRVEDGELPITVSRSERSGAAVVVVPSIYGVGDDLVSQMEEIADAGALVLAMDPFFRVKAGPIAYEDPEGAFERLGATDVFASNRDFRTLIGHARAVANGKVIGVGICFGGPFCMLAAADGMLAGVVTWHGSRLDHYLGGAAAIRCPLRLHFGDADAVVPLESVERVRHAFANHEDAEIVVHAGAGHGFSHRGAPDHHPSAERAGMDALRELVSKLR